MKKMKYGERKGKVDHETMLWGKGVRTTRGASNK
jgi:hypothetical protein